MNKTFKTFEIKRNTSKQNIYSKESSAVREAKYEKYFTIIIVEICSIYLIQHEKNVPVVKMCSIKLVNRQ